MKEVSDRSVALLLTAACVIFAAIGICTSGTFDAGDSIYHYLYAHYSFTHPELLLDHWAKPLFTLISSPFAYFGFEGMKVMNTIIMVFTAWIGYLVAKKLELKNSYLIPLF